MESSSCEDLACDLKILFMCNSWSDLKRLFLCFNYIARRGLVFVRNSE
jgi:hypothetical protein